MAWRVQPCILRANSRFCRESCPPSCFSLYACTVRIPTAALRHPAEPSDSCARARCKLLSPPLLDDAIRVPHAPTPRPHPCVAMTLLPGGDPYSGFFRAPDPAPAPAPAPPTSDGTQGRQSPPPRRFVAAPRIAPAPVPLTSGPGEVDRPPRRRKVSPTRGVDGAGGGGGGGRSGAQPAVFSVQLH